MSRNNSEVADMVAAMDQATLEELKASDLPDDEEKNFYEDEITGEKKQRSWLGKMGKGIAKRSARMGGLFSSSAKNDDSDKLAMVMSCRAPVSSPHGGVGIQNPEHAKACRSVLSLMLRQMGKNLLKGGNVMNVSFPIQCCQPRSILEIAATQAGFFHIFLPRAAATREPLERMKNVVSCFISTMLLTSGNFLKPLNPVLGETLQVTYNDGSKAYMEQTCHHPPVTSFMLEGATKSYKYYGYTTFNIGFGYNKMMLKNTGLRVLEFDDGGKIEIGFPNDRWGNVFWGDMNHESLGTQFFTDEKNCIRCQITFGERKGFPSDYFEGFIERYDPADPSKEGTILSNVEGSWVGFIDFDQVRYWDVRTSEKMSHYAPATVLPSDSRKRGDRNALEAKDYKLAQSEKTRLEELQRHERRLRETGQVQ